MQATTTVTTVNGIFGNDVKVGDTVELLTRWCKAYWHTNQIGIVTATTWGSATVEGDGFEVNYPILMLAVLD
jgi:hypothetical protein